MRHYVLSMNKVRNLDAKSKDMMPNISLKATHGGRLSLVLSFKLSKTICFFPSDV